MDIGFIGAGKVCHALSFYFGQDHLIRGIYSRRFGSAVALAEKIESVAYERMEDLVRDSELILISTTDDQIGSVVERMADLELSGKSVAHLSGSLSSELLAPLYEKGATVFSLHPVQSFSNPESALAKLRDTVFTFEGKGDPEQVVERLFVDLPNERIRISSESKCRYHIASVMLSNYLVTLYGLSEELMEQSGMSREQAQRSLLGLLDSTVNNLHERGFAALTGPLERGDVDTIRRHLADLQEDRLIETIYRSMAQETTVLLEKYGREVSEKMKKVLTKEE
ncbi:MAG: DUF2520 domain-containing protein [Peptostreptococcaceae bacterium]|nr:DUF2520 domain-containing protein [Peptostreptococcaceae bacterium]